MLYAGDLIEVSDSDADWGEWFEAGGHIHRMVPCLAAPGNHEYRAGGISPYWKPMFEFPDNGISGFEEAVYWVDYQGLRIVSLDSNGRLEEQAGWLEEGLKKNDNRWTVVMFHHPIYSSAAGRDNARLRRLWQPLFDKYRVDLVLTGHDHTYSRSGKMTYESEKAGISNSNAAGTVYAVSVSGPKMYHVNRQPFMVRAAEDTQLYQVIRIEYDRLHYEARTATGSLYDAFTLRKRPGMTNELINRIPDTPERRRQ
jgi:hypothetical protein